MMRLALLGSSSFSGGVLVRALEARLVGVEVVPLGRVGWSVTRWLAAELPPELEALEPADLVLLYLPGNFAPRAGEVAALTRRVRAATRARVLWCLPPVWPEGAEAGRVADAVARAIASESEALTGTRVRLEPGDLAGDGQHLSSSGASRLAALWAPVVRALARGGLPGWVLLVGATLAAWRLGLLGIG